MGYEPSHWNKINIHVGGAPHRAITLGSTSCWQWTANAMTLLCAVNKCATP